MQLRFNYRIYPNWRQAQHLAQTFGNVRVVWNDALNLCQQTYKDGNKKPSYSQLSKLCITNAKQTEERRWLKSSSSVPLQQTLRDLDRAYKQFFKSLKGDRKGKKLGLPRFKKKSNTQSARYQNNAFSLNGNKLYLAKIGKLKVKWSRPLPSAPTSVTVIKDNLNHYHVSFVVETDPKQYDAENQSIGVDLGIETFTTLSTGEKIKAPDYRKLDRKVRRAQRHLARCQKGSKRRERARLRVAKLQKKIANIRKDFLHKLSTRLVKESSVVVLEDLNVSGMMKNRCLSRAIAQQGWSMFRVMVEAKTHMVEDRELVVISRWEPTSQVCSSCGYRWGKLDLSVREVKCVNCGSVHDRDGNAAVNIENVGVGHTHDVDKLNGQENECKTRIPSGSTALSNRLVACKG